MAPKRNAIDLLFHPKPKKYDPNTPRPSTQQPTASSSKQAARPVASNPEDEEMKIPEGPFSEFTLVSSALNGWKYDVMKFDSRKPVDITSWSQPLKLNRKELKRPVAVIDDPQVGATPMKGLDGENVVRADGSQVMLDKDGRVIPAAGYIPPPKTGLGRKRMQKKTRQVYTIPDEQRQLKKDERYPWILEDASKQEVWVGRMDDAERSDTQAFFMPAMNNSFKFVPSHRWYKFQKRPNYYVPTLEEAENIMAKQQKDKDPHAWLLRNRKGQAPSAATAATLKAESEGRVLSAGSNSLVYSSGGQSLAFGGRKLKSVENSDANDLFGDDDNGEGSSRRKIKRENGGDGDFDEQVYESEHSDDEEENPEEKDDEGKEIEERLKREYQLANKAREGDVDESDDDDDEPTLTKDGKAMKKLLTGLEKNTVYDSDEDQNPYVSSEEEEEEEPPASPPEPAVKQPASSSNSRPDTPSKAPPRPSITSNNSRATSPNVSRGGHSIVAQRATSPKAPKIKGANGGRSSSPLGHNSRSASPISPSGSRAGSPMGSQGNKRKAADDGGVMTPSTSGSGIPPKMKKRKSTAVGSPAPSRPFEDSMLIEWLATTPNPTTRDCGAYFKAYLTDEAVKKRFIELIKTVASQKNGILTLNAAYRNNSTTST